MSGLQWVQRPDPEPPEDVMESAPGCELCSWVLVPVLPDGWLWKLKYVNRACADHGHLLGPAPWLL